MKWKTVRVALGDEQRQGVRDGQLATCDCKRGSGWLVFRDGLTTALYGQCDSCGEVVMFAAGNAPPNYVTTFKE